MPQKAILNPLPAKYERVEIELPESCPGCNEPLSPTKVEGIYYVWAPYVGQLGDDGQFLPERLVFDMPPAPDSLGPFPANIRCTCCGTELYARKEG